MRKYHDLPTHYKIVLMFAMLLVASQIFASGVQDSLAPISIENFGKLNDNYYRGSQPTAGQFDELKRLGIKTIVDLRQDSIEEYRSRRAKQGFSMSTFHSLPNAPQQRTKQHGS